MHGYSLEQANITVENFILKSYEEQIGKLIIVTGKGNKQRQIPTNGYMNELLDEYIKTFLPKIYLRSAGHAGHLLFSARRFR